MQNLAQTACLKHYLDATYLPKTCTRNTRWYAKGLILSLTGFQMPWKALSRVKLGWEDLEKLRSPGPAMFSAKLQSAELWEHPLTVWLCQPCSSRTETSQTCQSFWSLLLKHNSARFCALLQLCTSYLWSWFYCLIVWSNHVLVQPVLLHIAAYTEQTSNAPSVPPQLWYNVILWDHLLQNSFKFTMKVTLKANKHECRSCLPPTIIF